jgi:hypothetical protein
VGGCHCTYNTKWRKKTLAWSVDLPSVFRSNDSMNCLLITKLPYGPVAKSAQFLYTLFYRWWSKRKRRKLVHLGVLIDSAWKSKTVSKQSNWTLLGLPCAGLQSRGNCHISTVWFTVDFSEYQNLAFLEVFFMWYRLLLLYLFHLFVNLLQPLFFCCMEVFLNPIATIFIATQ